MSDEEKRKLLEQMRRYAEKVSSSDEEAKKLLAKTGMYTRTGNLKSTYK